MYVEQNNKVLSSYVYPRLYFTRELKTPQKSHRKISKESAANYSDIIPAPLVCNIKHHNKLFYTDKNTWKQTTPEARHNRFTNGCTCLFKNKLDKLSYSHWLDIKCTHIVIDRLILGGRLNTVGKKAEDGTDPEQDGESAEQLLTELHPLWCGGRRGQCIWTVAGQNFHRSLMGQTLVG